ncbi:MAG: YlxR family protein [Oscillospiraceae bacterium]|nr:YlxR family protein [Oscillospiraceae bacterium]MDE6003910.1 YlxR family protein [Oscillospiraceae bacterium]MDE6657439.1 YlxR family protein [Oscillospiraceae bacterium]
MQKKIPMRMCVGCGENKPKKELIRIVKSSENEISLDITGKKSGRGAYICKNQECFYKASKNHRLEKSFSCKISPEIYEVLQNALSEASRHS